jgi:cytochrome c oxidase subunit II
MRSSAYILLLAPLAAAITSARAAPLQSALQTTGVQASHILDLWRLTLGVCGFVFAAILIAFLYALWRAPRGAEHTPADVSSLTQPERGIHRTVLWAVGLSTVLLCVLLAADVATNRALARLKLEDAVNIELVGHQWWWEARYANSKASDSFTTANELHIPVGRPVIIRLTSSDVIHTFWVPSLHGKKDMIPGRTAHIQLRADKPGVYRGQCAEFCGLEHAMMAMLVVADPPHEYDAWAALQRKTAPPPSTPETMRGQQVFLTTTCVMCHTIQGTTANARMGPDLTHLASRNTIASGVLPNTKGHLAGWITDPQRIKPGVNMPANPLPPDDLQALLAYLETLK